MPRYDYHCTTCGVTFEVTQKMSDAALTTCTCGKDGAVSRQMSAGSGLIFKGSGFYITDYKNTGNASPASTGPAKTESAPAAPAPAAAPAAAAPSCGAGACGACSE